MPVIESRSIPAPTSSSATARACWRRSTKFRAAEKAVQAVAEKRAMFEQREPADAARTRRAAAGSRRALSRAIEPGRLSHARRRRDGVGAGRRHHRRHRLRRGRALHGHPPRQRIKGGTIAPMGQRQGASARSRSPWRTSCRSSTSSSPPAPICCYQLEIFVPGGARFANLARMSAAGIPQVTVVHGSSTAGGAYMPGLCDYVIMVRGRPRYSSPARHC